MGTMDVDSLSAETEKEMVKPSAHIFTSQSVPWFVAGKDGLQCWERFRPGFQERV